MVFGGSRRPNGTSQKGYRGLWEAAGAYVWDRSEPFPGVLVHEGPFETDKDTTARFDGTIVGFPPIDPANAGVRGVPGKEYY